MKPRPQSGALITLLVSCPDRRGIVAAVTTFLARHRGNIVDLQEHVDTAERVFFMRVQWEEAGFDLPRGKIGAAFRPIARRFRMSYELKCSDDVPRMAVFVSRQPHCLYDVLSRVQAGEWRVEVPVVVANHPDLEPVARRFGVRFEVFPITPANKARQEARELALLRRWRTDFVVLARYMQIISPRLINAFPHRIINIHHSFLPAFAGARPYHAAYDRGVKIIGATSHYVTAGLDTGPIIEQDVIRVSHKDSVADLIRKGRDLEKLVLARAIYRHLDNKILVYGNKTVVFD